ncbi:MAG TPA: DUF3343 domain-containing protein [Firmicutes bacterium]|nr:DUF3343 domain-containing protein [Bacillota bacterium]
MPEHRQGIILFFTTSAALRAERHLSGAGFKTKLVPTPRELSSDCGFALRFMVAAETSATAEEVEKLLTRSGIEFDAVHFPYPK